MSERTVDLSAIAYGMAEMHAALAKEMGYPGWTYRDIPWVTPDVWDKFFDIAGQENCKIIITTRQGDDRCRGQVLISPVGMARLQAHAAPPQPQQMESGR